LLVLRIRTPVAALTDKPGSKPIGVSDIENKTESFSIAEKLGYKAFVNRLVSSRARQGTCKLAGSSQNGRIPIVTSSTDDVTFGEHNGTCEIILERRLTAGAAT